MEKFVKRPMTAPEVEDIALPSDCGTWFMDMVKGDNLTASLAEASTYAKSVVSVDPMHVSGPCNTRDTIRQNMDADLKGTMRTSATLLDLNLEINAVNAIDVARIHWMLSEHTTTRSFKDAIGAIIVNYDTVDASGAQGQRLDKDAELHALCLLIHRTKTLESSTPLQNAVVQLASDLVIMYVHAGLGSASKGYTLRLINKEESKRKARIASMMWNSFCFLYVPQLSVKLLWGATFCAK